MATFQKILATDQKILLANFLRVYTIHGVQYFVTLRENYVFLCHFSMIVTTDGWRIFDSQGLPAGIIKLEKDLSMMISEQTTETTSI
ncbi:MAG: hypothetical protein ACJ75B_09990 [Flavisolibacter sp.]